MQKLLKWFRLPQRDRALMFQTVMVMGAVRLGLWLLPFKSLHRLLVRVMSEIPEGQSQDAAITDRVIWAVNVVSRALPGEVKCLARALTTRVLLSWQGQRSQLCIGVAKGEPGQLDAHAWVESQGNVIIGSLPDLARYTRLPPLKGEGA